MSNKKSLLDIKSVPERLFRHCAIQLKIQNLKVGALETFFPLQPLSGTLNLNY